MISALLNILWVVLGGFVMALGWWLAGLLCAITIIGLPWARSCFVIGKFSLWPFGQEAVNREELSGRGDLGTGPLGLIGNVLWFLVAGWWLAIGHLSSALACFVSIVGISLRDQVHQAGLDRVETGWYDNRAGALLPLNGLNPALTA